MADENQPEWVLPEEWQERLKSGMTMGPIQLDVPMHVDILPTGAIRISSPCVPILGSVHPVTLLLEISPLAAQGLIKALDALQKLQGKSVPEISGPTKQ